MSDFVQLTREFLAFLCEPKEASPVGYRRLSNLLDRIGGEVTHIAETGLPYDHVLLSTEITRESLSQRFSKLGLYYCVSPLMDSHTTPEITIGDAIDDLLDIAQELESALLQTDPLLAAAGGFYAHWGEHLRGLQTYLLALERGE